VKTTEPQRSHPILAAVSCVLTAAILAAMLFTGGSQAAPAPVNANILNTYERNLTNQISGVLEGVLTIPRVYELSDSDVVAPRPNQDCYYRTDDPAQMADMLARAQTLLKGQKTLFNTNIPIKEGSTVYSYLDETIFAVTWKQVVDDCTYTFSEVKIAHPSQLRRFLSEGRYNSGILHTTTEMSEAVNAVVASSGDYYDFRTFGVVVVNGQVYRERDHLLDTCYIDENGDLLFSYAAAFDDEAALQKFVDENHIRFSLCFGPVMVLDGEYCVPNNYNSGEINDRYARAALCQMDQLHYVVVAANNEEPNYSTPTVAQFGRRLYEMGIPVAYALDGGQTAAIVMNDQLINTVSYGAQREISDIFYFATALPEDRNK